MSLPQHEYWEALRRFKFVACPRGSFHFDSRRVWEALSVGTVPIVEQEDAAESLWKHWPVLVVPSFAHLTEDMLQSFTMPPDFEFRRDDFLNKLGASIRAKRDRLMSPVRPPVQRLVVATCVRNVERNEPVIRRFLSNVQSAATHMGLPMWFVAVESDSDDRTVDMLRGVIADFSGCLISLGNLEPTVPFRTERIARCRNRYLDEIEPTDLVLIVDMDNELSDLANLPDIAKTLVEAPSIGAITGNCEGPYYDIWALRSVDVPYDLFVEQAKGATSAVGLDMIRRHQRVRHVDEPWEIVESAFNGGALYHGADLESLYYFGLQKNGTTVYMACEHVHFNRMLRNRGRAVLFAPNFVICGTPP